MNICYMFRHSLCHRLITYQNYLLIVRLCYNGLVTEHEVYISGSLHKASYSYSKYWLEARIQTRYCLSN